MPGAWYPQIVPDKRTVTGHEIFAKPQITNVCESLVPSRLL